MAPKKSAKRVIQVPEEDTDGYWHVMALCELVKQEEPPAKKLQTSLKRQLVH